jgi:hypothetical protein
MPSVFSKGDRLTLERRLVHLTEASAPRWGRMDCLQMLAHLTDGVRMALGELAIDRAAVEVPAFLKWAPVRHAAIHWLPMPKGAQTARELVTRRAVSCDEERESLKRALKQLAALEGAQVWPNHPAFGRMGSRDWGALMYKHIDHHLRQFGV